MPKKREFYNEQFKKAFLSERFPNPEDQQGENVRSMFSKSCDMEKALEKDLCDFKHLDFVTFFEKAGYIKEETISIYKIYIINYVKWCISKGRYPASQLTEIERLSKLDITGNNAMRKNFFCTAKEVLDCIQTVYSYYGYSPMAYEPAQAFYGLSWYGLSKDEIYLLTPNQIDSKTGKIKTQSDTYDVPVEFAELILRVANYEKLEGLDFKKKNYAQSKFVFKTTKKDMKEIPICENWNTEKGRRWTALMKSYPSTEEFYGKRISYSVISRCGFYSRLYELEKSGTEVSARTISKMDIGNPETSGRSKINFVFSRFHEYQKWKSYYGLT